MPNVHKPVKKVIAVDNYQSDFRFHENHFQYMSCIILTHET